MQSARLGKSVVIAEASQHLGGLTTGGLGATDIAYGSIRMEPVFMILGQFKARLLTDGQILE